ncbi:hypothetical protein ERO13_A10G098501v2 [Gossypium hirsutum]|uniref:Uncharacterized protein n=3 Tax=Gossypium TaxID=3633 RepID=A0A5J5U1V6_GOSBA|nr:hypothetical protein ES319_A10G104500v1 [Gossypium barbadense]KAG4179298.1 hypothetical protein ERO13_A10G098501v2 [Gossypium hirsutum]TYG98400.1 hypothetical protein ES288_A10G114700v1 [Gossypium darwinii]TYI05795.1 hypothetical protein ES332_A10G114500v1 [Gossypium tomentosum]
MGFFSPVSKRLESHFLFSPKTKEKKILFVPFFEVDAVNGDEAPTVRLRGDPGGVRRACRGGGVRWPMVKRLVPCEVANGKEAGG